MRPREVTVALEKLSKKDLPVMMWGSPGVGKSSIVKQVAADAGRDVFDIRLALLDPTDLRGIPYYDPDTKTAKWAQSCILPSDPESNAIVFLDEINAAPPVVQAAAYQLVLDRRIGEYILPKGVSLIAAGNREGDKAVTFKMPTPLLNRFVHLEFDHDYEDWHDWAIKTGIEADVVGFLNFKKGMLNQFDPTSKSRSFPTPRTWEYVSRIISAGTNIADNIARGMIAGAIGDGAMIEFMSYREVYLTLPDPADVLDGRVKKMDSKKSLSSAYAMITSLGYELKERHNKHGNTDKFFDAAATYFTFIHTNFSPEFCVMGVRDCLKNLKLPMVKAPNWKEFAKDYAKLVIEA